MPRDELPRIVGLQHRCQFLGIFVQLRIDAVEHEPPRIILDHRIVVGRVRQLFDETGAEQKAIAGELFVIHRREIGFVRIRYGIGSRFCSPSRSVPPRVISRRKRSSSDIWRPR
jgi:hypothetical protein